MENRQLAKKIYKKEEYQIAFNLTHGLKFGVRSKYFHFIDHFNELYKSIQGLPKTSPEYKAFYYLRSRLCPEHKLQDCECFKNTYFKKELINRVGDINEIERVIPTSYEYCKTRYPHSQ